MLLNKHQKEQFKLDYHEMRMLDLTIKYGASDKKVTELALSMGLGLKRAGNKTKNSI